VRWAEAPEYAGMGRDKLTDLASAGLIHDIWIDGCRFVSRSDIDALFDEAAKRGHLDTTEYAIERRGAS
jgi:hypothetical protein